jgi:hypothetical protein
VKPWDTLRREILGAWRSVRYDLDHRAETREGGEAAGGDVGNWYSNPLPARDGVFAPLRDPRRVLTAAGVASVIAASATGTYFAVAGGLGILLADAAGMPVAPQAAPFAPFAPAPHGTSSTPGHRAAKPVHRTSPTLSARPAPAPAAPIVDHPAAPSAVPSAAPTTGRPTRSPVPEATPSVTPSSSPSPSVSPSASESPGYPLPSVGR